MAGLFMFNNTGEKSKHVSIWTLIMDRPGKVNKTSKYKFGTSKTSATWLQSLNNAKRKVLNIIF